MFQNFRDKINIYQSVFNLSGEQLARLALICDTYLSVTMKVEQTRATMAQLTAWQNAVYESLNAGAPVPPAPNFAPIATPAGAFQGIFNEFREMIAFIKANPAYTDDIGLDLMIVGAEQPAPDPITAIPDLRVAAKNETQVEIGFTRGAFTGVEVQFRRAGSEAWHLADKLTNANALHTPTLTNPGQPEKLEYRAIYLLRNQRFGKWSPVFSVTVG